MIVLRCSETRSVTDIFFLQMGCIEHYQSRQLARRCRSDDLAAKPSLGQQRQPSTMIKMGVGQQDVVDAGGIEPKRVRIVLVQLTATLVQPAVDQDPLSGALDHVTRTGDAAVGTVK
jgi:hypothetical protein